jgi:SAM-dependent methyltransferase
MLNDKTHTTNTKKSQNKNVVYNQNILKPPLPIDNLNSNSCVIDLSLTPIHLKARNEINERRLKWLEEYSQKLPLPDLFGEYISNHHHLDTIDLYIHATLETRHRGLFFLKTIIPNLSRKKAFLDIGPGKGKLTTWIGRNFSEVTCIDTSFAALENITESKFRNGVFLSKIQENFADSNIIHLKKFDFINMSHVIYYMSQDQILNSFNKAYDLLSENGILVIAFNEGLDRRQLSKDFGGVPPEFEGIFRKFSSIYRLHMEVYLSKESFYSQDLLTMLHICGLHLHDQGTKVDLESLKTYININYLNENGQYRMNMWQKFIVIKKEKN